MVAAIIATMISGLLRALGPHLKGQYLRVVGHSSALRNGSALTFSLNIFEGIIAFPSFHTVAAILLIYSHRPPVPSFRVMLMLNLLMLLSVFRPKDNTTWSM